MTQGIRVLELRSVFGTGGGPDKTILASAGSGRSDIAVTVCYLRHAGDRVFALGGAAARLGLDYVEVVERHALDPAIWRTLRALVRNRRIDIIHSHEYKTDLLAYLLAKVEPVLPLATAHGWTGHTWRERVLYYPADKRVLARFPRVIAVSSEVRRALVAAGVDDTRITVVLNGIDADRFRRDPARRAHARALYGLTETDVAIGAVGRLEPQKRFDLLIDAVSRLRATRPGLMLLIAGDGSLGSALARRAAERGLNAACRLVGHVQDVIAFHDALDLFVQSSDYEGTPNVVLEAMALETPIVATDVGGTAELITDGIHGLVVPPGRADDLARAIARALDDGPSARTRASAARRRVETDLSFAERLRRVEAIYDELARRSV